MTARPVRSDTAPSWPAGVGRRVLVTGSVGGLGLGAARALLADGHQVMVHARSSHRLEDAGALLGAGAVGVVGDLRTADGVRELVEQVLSTGLPDAVIHNAGVIDGPDVVAVNLLAPFSLTVLLPEVPRHIYLSSSMHRGGHPVVPALDGPRPRITYSDSKLLVTAFAMAVARLRPEATSHAVDPGWVPTRMGGPSATDDLELGHVTQAWLATSEDPAALSSGGYWFHMKRRRPHPVVDDTGFQDGLVRALARATGMTL